MELYDYNGFLCDIDVFYYKVCIKKLYCGFISIKHTNRGLKNPSINELETMILFDIVVSSILFLFMYICNNNYVMK